MHSVITNISGIIQDMMDKFNYLEQTLSRS